MSKISSTLLAFSFWQPNWIIGHTVLQLFFLLMRILRFSTEEKKLKPKNGMAIFPNFNYEFAIRFLLCAA